MAKQDISRRDPATKTLVWMQDGRLIPLRDLPPVWGFVIRSGKLWRYSHETKS